MTKPMPFEQYLAQYNDLGVFCIMTMAFNLKHVEGHGEHFVLHIILCRVSYNN